MEIQSHKSTLRHAQQMQRMGYVPIIEWVREDDVHKVKEYAKELRQDSLQRMGSA